MSTPKTPITDRHLMTALAQLSLLKFFPGDDIQTRALTIFLKGLCGHAEGLVWLVGQLVNQVGVWPGPADVRGIYCTRFKPADGIENFNCRLPGFTPADGEARAESRVGQRIETHEARQLLAGIGWKE